MGYVGCLIFPQSIRRGDTGRCDHKRLKLSWKVDECTPLLGGDGGGGRGDRHRGAGVACTQVQGSRAACSRAFAAFQGTSNGGCQFLSNRRSNRHIVPLHGKSDRLLLKSSDLKSVHRHLRYPGKLGRLHTDIYCRPRHHHRYPPLFTPSVLEFHGTVYDLACNMNLSLENGRVVGV